jgi:hypothetical protein
VTQTIEIEQPQVAGPGPLRLIGRYPLISYFVLAYAFTWTYDLLFLVLFPVPDIPGRSTPRDFGPSVAALVVTAVISGKSGLRRFFQPFLVWRVNPIWYLFMPDSGRPLGPEPRKGVCPGRSRPRWARSLRPAHLLVTSSLSPRP